MSKFFVIFLCLLPQIAQAQQYGPQMYEGRPYYVPQQRDPYVGQPLPNGFPPRGLRNGPSQYYWNPRQSGPYDPYHGMPRMDYFSPCRSNPYACGWPP